MSLIVFFLKYFLKYGKKKKNKLLPIVVIGNIKLLKKQIKFFKYNIQIKKINSSFSFSEISGNFIPVIDVKYDQNKPFQKITSKSNKFIFRSFEIALNLIKNKKVFGLVNGPIAKETLLKEKFNGITEYLSSNLKIKGREVMLIYNPIISVSPLTTHIPIFKVAKSLNKNTILYKVNLINNFFKRYFKKKITIGVTGLNPHCYSTKKDNAEKKIIIPAIKILKKKMKIFGPLSADTIFLKKNIKKFDLIIGMYHDQVLSPMKALFEQNAINVTLGLPFLRVSPDHGVGSDIVGKKLANPISLIKCIDFFKKIK